MTTKHVDRLQACFDFLTSNKSKERHDYAALYAVAKRIGGMKDVPEKLKSRAANAAAVVEKLAEAHVAALKLPDKIEFGEGPWTVHLPIFLRNFAGVPACDALAEKLTKTLEKHKKTAIKHLRIFYQKRGKKEADAFQAGVTAIQSGFLHYECMDSDFLSQLEKWSKDARKLRLGKKAMKGFQATVPAYRKAIKEGYREFDAVNRKVGKL
jgi:hypothetical protein